MRRFGYQINQRFDRRYLLMNALGHLTGSNQTSLQFIQNEPKFKITHCQSRQRLPLPFRPSTSGLVAAGALTRDEEPVSPCVL